MEASRSTENDGSEIREISKEEADQKDRSVKRAKKVILRNAQRNGNLAESHAAPKPSAHGPLNFRDAVLNQVGRDKGSEGAEAGQVEGSCSSPFNQGSPCSSQHIDDQAMLDLSDQLCPRIIITDGEMQKFCTAWKGSLIMKVLGKKVGFTTLRLQELWNPKGDLNVGRPGK